jgi:hypothetical protein
MLAAASTPAVAFMAAEVLMVEVTDEHGAMLPRNRCCIHVDR